MLDIPRDYPVRLGDCADAHRRSHGFAAEPFRLGPDGFRSTIAARILYRNRVARIQRMIAYSCIALALASLAYMGGEFARVML